MNTLYLSVEIFCRKEHFPVVLMIVNIGVEKKWAKDVFAWIKSDTYHGCSHTCKKILVWDKKNLGLPVGGAV